MVKSLFFNPVQTGTLVVNLFNALQVDYALIEPHSQRPILLGNLRWLDWIFWGWYLPTLSINYVGMSKDMEKRLPQLYYIKMKISYDLGFIAIGVAMAT